MPDGRHGDTIPNTGEHFFGKPHLNGRKNGGITHAFAVSTLATDASGPRGPVVSASGIAARPTLMAKQALAVAMARRTEPVWVPGRGEWTGTTEVPRGTGELAIASPPVTRVLPPPLAR